MLSDQPITTAKEDLLGRSAFARQIASAMLACPAKGRHSFAIGLCGSWGSGKTSLLNLTEEALQKRKAGGAIVIRFNPWQYPSAEMLPGQFLQMLAAALTRRDNGKKLRKAGKAVARYAAALQYGGPLEPAAKKKKRRLQKDVLKKKAKACKRLKKQKRRIFVMMDDIDRLSSRRIRHALQLVNTVADFPRMVYLLSFDQDIVANALAKELNADGRAYLQKFMQAVYPVPAPPSGRIQAVLDAYFEVWRQAKADLNCDPAYLDELKPFLYAHITSIRDVYRFINTFRFHYQLLGNEVNFADLAAVTALQLHVPRALPWMLAHRDDLLRGGGLAFATAGSTEKQRLKRDHQRMIGELGANGDKTLLPLIGHMFPRYGANVLDVYGEEPDQHYMRMRRICCEEFFDLYFTLSPETLTVTRQEIMRSVRTMDAAALRAFTDGMQAQRRGAYIAQLPHYLEDIDNGKLPMFFLETLWLSRLPEEKTPSEKPLQRSHFQSCCYAALCILAQMDADTQAHCLAQAIENAAEGTLPALAVLVQRIQSNSPDAEGVTVGRETVRAYGERLLRKIRAYADGGNWLLTPHPLPVLTFWKQADDASFMAYFNQLMLDDGNMARLLSCLTRRFDRGARMEYQYGDMDGRHAFSDDFTRADALAAILRLRGTPAFAALPQDVQLDCVAFSLMDDQINRVAHRVVLDACPAWQSRVRG